MALMTALASPPTLAGEHLSRRVDWRAGAPMSSVDALDQDAQGFLWLATPQGLIRYDGMEMRIIDPAAFAFAPGCARTGNVRAIRAMGGSRELVELEGTTVVKIPIPESVSASGMQTAACSDDGVLWAMFDGELWRRPESAGWLKAAKHPGAEAWDSLWPGRDGNVLTRSGRSVFLVSPAGAVKHLGRLHMVISCFLREDGALVALDWKRDGGYLMVVRDGRAEQLAFQPRRPIAVIERKNTIWVAFDSSLLGVRPDGTQMEIGPSPSSLVGGGPLLVDREDALWVGTSRGLVEFPEPDTAGIDPDPGGGRWLLRFDHDLLLTTWAGAWRLVGPDGRRRLIPATESIGAVCEDSRGRTWTVFFEELKRTDPDGRVTKVPFEHVGSMAPCTLDPSGTLWMPTLLGLLRLGRDDDRPSIEPLPGRGAREDDGDAAGSVLLDRHGRLWVGGFGRVCNSESPNGGARTWSCEPVPSGSFVSHLVEANGGRIWAASEGVYERGDDGNWRRLSLEAGEALAPPVTSLAPSPRGGIWLVGQGTILRVAGESAQGRMTVLERLGGWHGIPTNSAIDAMEMDDGTVWLVVETTLVRVPGSVRTVPPAPSRVAVTGLLVDGVSSPVDLEFRSPYRRNRFEVRVSAFSYRDPSLLRYRFRMKDSDPWSEATANPVFQFYNVSSGRYALRFAASLDGERWTETGSTVRFRIDPPWFLQTWFVALVALAATTVGWGMHRVRVSRLVALERQRTRIAMDLHDAIGSGLGSIGLLAGLGSRQATDPEKRREISDQIAVMASELGMSLSEIVWSLSVGSERLEALAQYLKERANKLFVDGDVRFRTEFPGSWPDAPLSLPLRRNLLLITVEALHNAARHAEASEVCLGMAPDGSLWSLWVEDDGVGIERGVNPGTGMGLSNMKRRAEEVDATVEWTPRPVKGTRVTVIFDPHCPHF